MSSWDPCRTAEAVESLFARNSGPAIIVAPFAKENVLKRLCSIVGDRVDLYTRWLPHEIAAGVSDLGVLDPVEQTGGAVRLHPLLHAKLYLRGGEALVGSANASSTGLGYRRPSAVELVVPVALPCDPVSRLLEMLGKSSTEADVSLQEAIAQEASRVDVRSLPPTGTSRDGDLLDDAWGTGLLGFRDPKTVWFYYSNPARHSSELGSSAVATVLRLGVPLGITDRSTFKAFVGAAMRQGVHGRVLRECKGLPPHAAVARYLQVLSDVGTEVPDGEADREWRAFCNWAEEFVPEVKLRSVKVGF